MTVPASVGRAHGKATYRLSVPGVAKFAFVTLEGRASGSVKFDVKGKGAFDVSGTRIYLDKDAAEIVAGLSEVKLENSSSVPRTVSVVAGVDFPPADDPDAHETNGAPQVVKKVAKKKVAKKKVAKKKVAKKKVAKKNR